MILKYSILGIIAARIHALSELSRHLFWSSVIHLQSRPPFNETYSVEIMDPFGYNLLLLKLKTENCIVK